MWCRSFGSMGSANTMMRGELEETKEALAAMRRQVQFLEDDLRSDKVQFLEDELRTDKVQREEGMKKVQREEGMKKVNDLEKTLEEQVKKAKQDEDRKAKEKAARASKEKNNKEADREGPGTPRKGGAATEPLKYSIFPPTPETRAPQTPRKSGAATEPLKYSTPLP
ncbi:hypothetical protein T484DRAFT_1807921 [Baffinella frigidus]|nr:hypothetical protein T484DRAFT_1807921 [Cryptophyta sp. CCMP2293]